MQDKLNF